MSTRRPWSPERRAAASIRGRQWWEGLSDEERADRAARSRAAFEAKYPHRVELYAGLQARLQSGELVPEPCDRCGGEGRMMLRYDDEARTVELLGWRCYPCRRVRP